MKNTEQTHDAFDIACCRRVPEVAQCGLPGIADDQAYTAPQSYLPPIYGQVIFILGNHRQATVWGALTRVAAQATDTGIITVTVQDLLTAANDSPVHPGHTLDTVRQTIQTLAERGFLTIETNGRPRPFIQFAVMQALTRACITAYRQLPGLTAGGI